MVPCQGVDDWPIGACGSRLGLLSCHCPMTCKERAHCSPSVQALPTPGTGLVLCLRPQPAPLLILRVSSCLVVSADIVHRSGIMHEMAVGVNGYPAEPKPSMVSAVDFTLRRLATYLLHGEPLFWWCCSNAADVVATSLYPPSHMQSVDRCLQHHAGHHQCSLGATLHPGRALSPGHTLGLLGGSGKQFSAECDRASRASLGHGVHWPVTSLSTIAYRVQSHASWPSCWLGPLTS